MRSRPQFSRKNRFFSSKKMFLKHSKRSPSTETSTISTNSMSGRSLECGLAIFKNIKIKLPICCQNIAYSVSENIELDSRKMGQIFGVLISLSEMKFMCIQRYIFFFHIHFNLHDNFKGLRRIELVEIVEVSVDGLLF